LLGAVDSGASSEVGAFVLFEHFDEAAGGDDPSGVDEAVEEASLDVEGAAEFVLDFVVRCRSYRSISTR
jgi:hypothetical protein